MSFHIEAKPDQIAESVIMPGDPLRAKYIAEEFLSDSVCYNKVRGMLGYTGNYKGKRVSIQGTGMGIPSISIYATELIKEYGVKELIRIGTCGSVQEYLGPRDIIMAVTASSNSSMNNVLFGGEGVFSPCADFELLQKAYNLAKDKGMRVFAGNVLTSDLFYHPDNEGYWKKWADYGILALEMETSGLYTIASRNGVKALAILTVSDSIIENKSEVSSIEKEKSLNEMIEIALNTI